MEDEKEWRAAVIADLKSINKRSARGRFYTRNLYTSSHYINFIFTWWPMKTVEQILDEIQARCDAATKGPTEVHRFDNSGLFSYQIETPDLRNGEKIIVARTSEYGNMPKAKADSDFISNSFTDLPKLLKAFRVLWKSNEYYAQNWAEVSQELSAFKARQSMKEVQAILGG